MLFRELNGREPSLFPAGWSRGAYDHPEGGYVFLVVKHGRRRMVTLPYSSMGPGGITVDQLLDLNEPYMFAAGVKPLYAVRVKPKTKP